MAPIDGPKTTAHTRRNRYEFAKLLAETFSLDKKLITPVPSKEIKWIAKRPKDASLNINKAHQTLRNKPLKIEQALTEMKKEIEQANSLQVT